jgi:chromosome segregation ATPase
MSQIETIMLVALGFVGALLVGLLVVRGLWAYAVSLGKRRVERRAPSAIAELQADRDRLKAEYAMQGRRLQLRLDDLKTRMAEQMAEASRNRNRIEQLVSEIRNRDEQIAGRDDEITALRSQSDGLERELTERTALVQQTKDLLLTREEETTELRGKLTFAETRLADQTAIIENIRNDVPADATTATSAVTPAAEGNFESAHDRLRQRIEELNALTRHIDDQRRDLSVQQEELTTLREQINRAQKSDGKSSKALDVLAGKAVTGDGEQGKVNASALSAAESTSDQLERQIMEAEQETENLTTELARLDEMWNANVEDVQTNGKLGSRLSLVASDNSKSSSKARTAKKRAASKKARKPKATAGARKATRKTPRPANKPAASKSATSKTATGKTATGKPKVSKPAAKKAAAKKTAARNSSSKRTKPVSLPEVVLPASQANLAKAAAAAAAAAKENAAQAGTATVADLPQQPQQDDGNVISLAQRIRALQTDISRNS